MHMYQLCACRTPQLCVGIFQHTRATVYADGDKRVISQR